MTGGAGYIGSTLVRLLLKEGYKVRVLDSFKWGEESIIGVCHDPDFDYINGDIRDIDTVSSALDGVNGVVHLAAIVGDPACNKEPELARETNLEASKILFEKAKTAGVGRFVFVSTCSNYGKMSDLDGYVAEDSELKPVSLYAKLKVSAEKHVLDSKKKEGFEPVVLRFATAYGISPRMRFDLTVNEFVRELYAGKELLVFGENFWRPYCHIVDLSKACIQVLKAPPSFVDHQVFNVGDSAENYQKQMIVDEIRKVIPGASVKYVKKDEDPRDYKVDFTKIKDVLGFSVTRKVPDGITEIIDALSNNTFRDPYDNRYKNTTA